jgi:hypothetical protein
MAFCSNLSPHEVGQSFSKGQSSHCLRVQQTLKSNNTDEKNVNIIQQSGLNGERRVVMLVTPFIWDANYKKKQNQLEEGGWKCKTPNGEPYLDRLFSDCAGTTSNPSVGLQEPQAI